MTTRRVSIQNTIGDNFDPRNANAGLWLDKFIYDSENNLPKDSKFETAKSELVHQVTQKIGEPAIYKKYFEGVWQKQLQKYGAICRYATVKNRLAINLGSVSVLETSIALHRVFGLPYIPGSGLKGLVSHFIHQYGGKDWNKESENHIVVFGDQENAGFVTFHDALFVPGSGYGGRPLYADVMTTHHQNYYAKGNTTNPPADWDSPNPVPFISATGKYLLALSGPEEWVQITYDILEFALQIEGVGAKTSSGYGRMFFTGGVLLSDQQIEEQKADQFTEIFNKLDGLFEADKETRKAINKEIYAFAKKIKDKEKKKEAANQLYKKAEDLGKVEILTQNGPTWFKWVVENK